MKTTLAASLLPFADASTTAKPVIANTQVDQFVRYTSDAYGYELDGSFDAEVMENGVTKLWPESECALAIHWTATDTERIPIAADGELYLLESGIVGDTNSRGDVIFEHIVGDLNAFGCNDYVRSNVTGVDFTGDCWHTIISDPETGVYTKKCGKTANQQCNATVHFSGGAADQNFTWECITPGGEGRKATGNSSSGTFTAHCAN